jgi:hypothetical protein
VITVFELHVIDAAFDESTVHFGVSKDPFDLTLLLSLPLALPAVDAD